MNIKNLFLNLKKFRQRIPVASSNNLIILLAITLIILLSSFAFLFQRMVKSQRRSISSGPNIVRSEEGRNAAIKRIKELAGENVEVKYLATDKSLYNPQKVEETYQVGLDMYVIDQATNYIVFYSEKIRTNKDDPKKEYDYTPRYTSSQLEKMARAFMAKHAPSVDLSKLTYNPKIYDNRAFFRWEDTSRQLADTHKMAPFIQIGYSVGGDILSYTNTLIY